MHKQGAIPEASQIRGVVVANSGVPPGPLSLGHGDRTNSGRRLGLGHHFSFWALCPSPTPRNNREAWEKCSFADSWPSQQLPRLVGSDRWGRAGPAFPRGSSAILNHSSCRALGLPKWPPRITPASCCVFAEHCIQTGAPASNPEGCPHSTEHPRQWAAARIQ